jgi:hypothetical protein
VVSKDSLLSASPIFLLLLLITKTSPFHSVCSHAAGRAEPPKTTTLAFLLGIARQSGFWVVQDVCECSTIIV